MGVGVIGSMIGAPFAGYIYDTTGTYQPAWYLYSGIAVLCLLCVTFVPAMKKLETEITEIKPGAETK